MARSDNNLKAVLQDTANAIRAKTGASEPIIPRDFADEIENMPTGGGDDIAIIERTISGEYSNAQISVVGSNAFAYCNELTSVNLPNCTEIGNYAFASCFNLEIVNFPNCIKVSNGLFYSCQKIREAYFEKLEVVPNYFLSTCSSTLTVISFPKAKVIGTQGFYWGHKIETSLYFPDCVFVASSGCLGLKFKNINPNEAFPNLLHLGPYAFEYCHFQDGNVHFPKCRYIEMGAFSNISFNSGFCDGFVLSFPECKMLNCFAFYGVGGAYDSSRLVESIYLPKLKIIEGDNAKLFSVGGFLGSIIELPNAIVAGCLDGNYSTNHEVFYSFPNCISVGQFNVSGDFFGPKIARIKYNYYVTCKNKQSIEMSNLCLVDGGYYMFSSACSELTRIDFPILYNLSTQLFIEQLSNLEQLNMPNLRNFFYGGMNLNGNTKLSSLSLNNIQSMSFSLNYFSALESFYLINKSTTAVPLKNVNIFQTTPMSNSTYLGRYGSIYVHPDRVATYQNATNWATYASRITAAPSEMLNEAIWAYEFQSSTLTEIPSEKLNVQNVGNFAFQGCLSLSEINLQECLVIGDNAFQGCSLLSQVNAPKTKFVGSSAFILNSLISSINFPSCVFMSPCVFYRCSSLETANLPECIEVGGYAFYNCSKLSSLNIEKCLKVDYSAFQYCYALSQVKLPYVSFINNYAFCSCSSMKKAFLPFCKSIFTSAFAYCSSLEEVLMPFIYYISSFAFYSCSKLEKLYLFDISTLNVQSRAFSYTPLVNSSYLGHFGSIYVRASMLEYIKENNPLLSQGISSDRFVGLTDEEIASVYSSFGYNVEDF